MTNAASGEAFALEVRAEELSYLSGDRLVRRGESDRLEVGSGPGREVVSGTERMRIGGDLSERIGRDSRTRASRVETAVEGQLTQRFKSDTTLLGGAMTEIYTGGVFVGAGMSDDLVVGGGMRVTTVDLWMCGIVGMEEKIGSAAADGALVELYRLAFEREYGPGLHLAGAAVLSGKVHCTMATGFRQLFKVANGVRDLTPGAGGEGGGDAPAPPVAPPPGGGAGSGTMLAPQSVSALDDVEDAAGLEDLARLAGELDTAVDGGQNGDRSLLLQDASRLAELGETGEDAGDSGALVARLGEGNGLDEVLDLDDVRAMLPPDESPETLSEPGRVITDDPVTPQVLGDDANRLDDAVTDAVLNVEDSGLSPRLDDSLEPLDMSKHRSDLGLPENFDYEQARQDFYEHYTDRFRLQHQPGTSEMEAAGRSVDEHILTHAAELNPEWVEDLGLSAGELDEFYTNSPFAYQKMTEMESQARASGDVAKADFLRGILDNIDAHQYHAYQGAIERAEALREAALGSRLPESVNQQALFDALDEEYDRISARIKEITDSGLVSDDPELAEEFYRLSEKQRLYLTARDAVAEGRDGLLFVNEMVSMSQAGTNVNPASIAGSLEAQSELMQIFSDSAFGFTVDVGEMRSALGVGDFDMKIAVTDMAERIDEYATDATPGTTVLRDAVDRGDERALTQLENLPPEWLEEAGLDNGSGGLSGDVRGRIEQDPGSAYRILTEMEAEARADGIEFARQQHAFDLLDEGTRNRDLDKADYLAGILARLDRDAMLDFESATDAAAALRAADNVPLGDDVNQAALLEAIQDRIDALDARKAALDEEDAANFRELAQIETERAFLIGAQSRIEDGYDPGPRLREMLLIAQDATGGDAGTLEDVAGVYRSVFDLLDDPRFRLGLAGFDDADQFEVVTPLRSVDVDLGGIETPDESRLGDLGGPGPGGDPFFEVTDEPIYDTPWNSELRRRLDIGRSQVSVEETSSLLYGSSDVYRTDVAIYDAVPYSGSDIYDPDFLRLSDADDVEPEYLRLSDADNVESEYGPFPPPDDVESEYGPFPPPDDPEPHYETGPGSQLDPDDPEPHYETGPGHQTGTFENPSYETVGDSPYEPVGEPSIYDTVDNPDDPFYETVDDPGDPIYETVDDPGDPLYETVPAPGPQPPPDELPPPLPPRRLPAGYDGEAALDAIDDAVNALTEQIDTAAGYNFSAEQIQVLKKQVAMYKLARAAIEIGNDPRVAVENAFITPGVSTPARARVEETIEFLDRFDAFGSAA